MAAITFKPLTETLFQYVQTQFVQESDALKALREFALQHEFSHKMTSPEQTQFLCFLLKLIGAKRVIEVGTFVGYTTLAMAEALPDEGEVVTCEKNEAWLTMGQPFWAQAPCAHKISVCLDDALISLQNLIDEGQAASFDFIYVDADKRHYERYLELGLQLINSRGLLVFDNVLRVIHGDVADPGTPATRALDRFNKQLHARADLDVSVLPMNDGVLLLRRRW
ncbi:MAG: SAM-dependent methyltransferase [Coxiella sp. (in: Bacteria)]|nr:MAG: SAM-dependent methyltransferase [Coxiella sp. (in: g-proteobacteria)]